MKKTLRALLGVSALALMFVSSPVLAASVNVTGDNLVTGADSDNENEYEVDNDLDVDVDNEAEDIDNIADVDADTGGNEQEKNTTAGGQESGAVDVSGEWETVVNEGSSLMGAAEGDLDVTGDFLNDTTGADSDNENELDVDNDVELDLENMADIFNKLDFDAETGDNEQNKNTEAGDQESGAASLTTMISNWANNEAGLDGAAGNAVSVDVAGENSTTGADSDNENEFDIDNDYDLEIDNDADVDNKVDVDIHTGGNEQNKNTTGGNQTSGKADVLVDLVNDVNNGSSVAGAGLSDVAVEGTFTNDTTGADSDNKNELDVENEVDVDVDNDAEIDNDVDVDANTGDNEQNKNTEAGSQTSGDVDVEINITNSANNS
jgi:hypothetical protein